MCEWAMHLMFDLEKYQGFFVSRHIEFINELPWLTTDQPDKSSGSRALNNPVELTTVTTALLFTICRTADSADTIIAVCR